ncbi:MAG: hypothetical protein LQ351_001653 [Letrouitia transgressa]|nr:MAG: hypothetical protein LQ351_001653 [Letrouitia transgressa]
MICGDLDSLLPEVKEYYESKGCQIVEDSSQDSTDIAKCLKQIESQTDAILSTIAEQKNMPKDSYQSHVDVVLLGGLGGRIDQALSILHHLYKSGEEDTLKYRLFLVSPHSVAFVLVKGSNLIVAPSTHFSSRASIGIIPIGRPAIVSTRGLKWDVDDWPTEFGTQISTSNYAINDCVSVTATERVLFTIEISQTEDK